MRVLILSTTTGYQLRSFGAAADALGIELMFGTDRCHAIDDPWQDRAVPVRFEDVRGSVAAVVKAAAARPIGGLVAVGDRPVVVAAHVASALGIPWHSADGAAASANKRMSRERLAAAGLVAPWHFPVPPAASAEDAARRARYPAVVKPLGLSGSRGVIRANSPAELIAAIVRVRALLARPELRAMRFDYGEDLLVEGYLGGPEYAIEGLATRGAFRPLAIFQKPDPLDGPYFEETIYITPPDCPPSVRDRLVNVVGRAAAALGLSQGPVHAECRLTAEGEFVLEVAGRPIGGLCSRVLRFGADGGVSLEALLLRHACGEDVSAIEREPSAAGVMMIPIPGRGIYRTVEGVERARGVAQVEDVHITAKPDQLLEPLPEAGSYLGFIFSRGQSAAGVLSALREAHGRLSFTVDPALPMVAPAPR
jgi:biotin carboxylase